ncbi:MAG: glycosyltransferase family 2 protein [Planctomycetota bacterium]
MISDNASTDKTQQICQAFADQDPRICYFRNPVNIGASGNFNRVFELSKGQYFKWMAHDDIIAPDFLARCITVLECDPSIVLCFSTISIVDTYGAIERSDFSNHLARVGLDHSSERFGDLILERHGCYHIWGLMRATVLAKTSLIGNYIGSDRGLLAELGLYGRLYEISEDLFMLRNHTGRSCKALPFYLRTAWFDSSMRGKRVLPNWRILLEYLKAVQRAPLSLDDRVRCHLLILYWIGAKGNWARLLLDLLVALVPDFWRLHMTLKGWFHGRYSKYRPTSS